jgi:hypothetical protein
MKRLLIFASATVALAGVAASLSLAPNGRAQAATFQVDYDHGRDDRDGRTAATAWKHSPGDPEAKGVPARTTLVPGDEVLFASKVRYRGSIIVTASGAPAAPIVFTSAAAEGSAIIDGSEPVTDLRPCSSANDCGGAAQWQKLVRFESPLPMNDDSAVFSEAGPLRPAQTPNPKDDFYRDEVADMREVDGAAMSRGVVALPQDVSAGLSAGGGRLALWVQPNLVVYRPILSIEGNLAHFDPTGLKFYTDRPARAAVIDHVSLIDRAGEYVVLANNTTVIAMLPPRTAALSVASGRFGFRVRGASNLVFRDLSFENMSDGGKWAPAGVGIYADKGNSPSVSRIRIENNVFRNFVMPKGQGPIAANYVDNLQIVGNRMDTMVLGSGLRLSGPSTNTLIENNDIRHVGRTAIAMQNVSDVTVRGNRISDVRGVHGNGISAYLDSHNVKVIANTVLDAKYPATFEGATEKATQDNNLVFANNLFVATPDALGALISWGGGTRGVTIRNNVMIGSVAGLRLHGDDSGVTVADNISSGLLVSSAMRPDFTAVGNEWTALTWQQKQAARGPNVSSRLASDAALLLKGQPLASVCAVIKRHSVPAEAGATEAEGYIGADLHCP